MYIKRHVEKALREYGEMFGAVLVCGSRQVGKSTMLRKCLPAMSYVTLDDYTVLEEAANDANLFFKNNEPPMIIDEIQYAPNLFRGMKIALDRTHAKGQFYMSGSQQFHIMKNVAESLAGRLGIIELLGLSMREIEGINFYDPFLPTERYIAERKKFTDGINADALWRSIHSGGMPELAANPKISWNAYFAAYLRTYIERDVRDLSQVGDTRMFVSFMTSIAARTGQILNKSAIANEVGVSAPTIERWITILEGAGLVFRLKPYSNNAIKRETKMPKLYFLNTGLAAYLTGWNTPDVLRNGAMSGAYFETFVFCEILKSYYNMGIIDPAIYFYRDRDGHEIDLLLEEGQILYPVEIKKHASPTKRDSGSFSCIDGIYGKKRGEGCVICMYDKVVMLSEVDRAIPVSYI